MQDTERGPRHQSSAVRAHTADRLRDPGGISREQFVIFLDAHEFDDSQLHDELIHQFLRFRFGEDAVFEIAFDINIEEGAVSADRHRRAVLILDCGEIAKIEGLYGFLRVFCGLRNVPAIDRRQRFQGF